MPYGLLLAPRGAMILSTIMDETLIDEIAERAAAAMADLAKEIASSS